MAAQPPKRAPGAKAYLVLGLGIAMLVAGLATFVLQTQFAGSRELWILGGAALGIGGIVALVYYFDKFGKL
jgi:uncharacterized membrane protein HdeD (DUF308 family)